MKNKLKKFFRNFDLREGAASLMFLVLGILFIVFPEGMLKTLCYVAGALTLVWGIVRMILYFREEGGVHVYDVVILAAVMVAGILLIVAPAFVSEFITVLLGVLLILDSISKIIESRELYKLNKGAEWLTAAIIGVVCAVLGMIIIFNPFATTRVLMIFVGISLLLDSVCSLTAACIYAAMRAGKDEAEGEVIDI
ncbi:MAG TPA: DUF308 domain-containing protein [Candidatus Coproplasma avistercoris]|nr:DUF308 domain-containing protein [Candidatus Coproplasma avistercoris]